MARWLSSILKRIRALAGARAVLFTQKARRELAALGSGLDEDDACEVLARLAPADSAGRLLSEVTGEWSSLFRPSLARTPVYVKIVVRSACIVISFHEDEGRPREEQNDA